MMTLRTWLRIIHFKYLFFIRVIVTLPEGISLCRLWVSPQRWYTSSLGSSRNLTVLPHVNPSVWEFSLCD